MQSLSYMLWMRKKKLMTFSLEVKVDFISNEGLFNSRFIVCTRNGDIYHIELKSL